jgi:hypothetical protein
MKITRPFCRYAINAAMLSAMFLMCRRAEAFNWNVTSAADINAAGTLRFAVNNAAASDTISFAGVLGGQTITLTLGELQIMQKNLIINGLGPLSLSIVDANGRVFHVMPGVTGVQISGLHLTGQLTGTNGSDGTFFAPDGQPGESVIGGCILNDFQAVLTVSNCFFEGCQAVGGNGGNGYTNDNYGFLSNGGKGGSACAGAIYNFGDLFVNRCAFSSNSASGGGGGNGYYSGAGGAGGAAQGGAICDIYAGTDIFVVDNTFNGNFVIAGYGGNAGDAYMFHIGPANGGAGGAGGEASGGAIYMAQACPNADCTGLVHNTISHNMISPGKGQPGGSGINGGIQGPNGVNGSANGGGLYHSTGHGIVPIDNTIVAGDFATFRFTSGNFDYNGPDIFGDYDSFCYNLISVVDGSSSGWVALDMTGSTALPVDARLGPFQNNGGETPTMAPMTGSPAIDAGNIDGCGHPQGGSTHDQIGQPRPVIATANILPGDGSDIGAYEVQCSTNVPTLSISQSGAAVTISWPTPSTCWILQHNSDLTTTNWMNATYMITVSGNQNQVVISPPPPGALFFRLFHL